jgi:DNA polymerase-3 subunit chi
MTRIDFYVLQEGARLTREHLVCLLAHKAYDQGQSLYIHASSREEVNTLDELLWTFRDISFLPHQRIDEGLSPDAPIVIGCGEAPPETTKLMINLAHPPPPFVSQIDRIIEVVSQAPDIRQQARERYRYYQAQGYSLNTHAITSYHE